MNACGILTIKHSHTVITDMAQKQNEHYGCMWYSDNQALTSCDYKHCTEAGWALWMHMISWQSSTHFLWSQKLNEHHGCMWDFENQVLTFCDHKYGTEAQWVLWMDVEFWQCCTHFLWSQAWHRSRMRTVWVWKSDNEVLTNCDYKHDIDIECANDWI